MADGAERARLRAATGDTTGGGVDWRAWGPYLAERAWGTVREDYSADGDAWTYLPHEHARSRAYRWNEDGMAGLCDDKQTFCFALALWNGADPILKERMFGLSGVEGNHGEDAKEYWWYLDNTPTHSWMRWRYHYPQAAFPYGELVRENALRSRADPEYELLDTGVFEQDRYWAVTVDYAKADPTDVCLLITVHNRGPDLAMLHVLPTLWFRNTWAWGLPGESTVPPTITAGAGGLVGAHPALGRLVLAGDGYPRALFCDNETNTQRLYGTPGRSAYPKDGINDHVVHGAPTVNPASAGTKGALHYRLSVPAGGSATIRLRLYLASSTVDGDLGAGHAAVLAARSAEADAFYAALTPSWVSADQAVVLRQALAGMLWSKQFYHYDVRRWLDGDPAGPPPPADRLRGRNITWWHLANTDVISMPDPWEYPWYAAWDLAFHALPLAHVDPWFAKRQLLLLLREWYMHPNGQLPAYEWSFDDVNPPVHAWAALRVFEIDGSRDFAFLARVFHKLLLNFTWWVNRKDSEGNNVFEGGFLGLDNIGPLDRSKALPLAGTLEQSDGTAWMAMYCLNMLEIALVLAQQDHEYEDVASKFFEHFAYIAAAAYQQGLWAEDDGFFYDVLSTSDGRRIPLRVRSMVGLLPLAATTTLGLDTLRRLPGFARRFGWFLRHRPEYARVVGATHVRDGREGRLLSMVGPEQLGRLLARMLDEAEFLSPYGLRSMSRAHLAAPFTLELPELRATVGYEPAESRSGLFGGNSNWRGPVWFPVNYLLIESLCRFARFFGADYTVEHPTGSGVKLTLAEVAADLSTRLVSIFTPDASGRRPVFGSAFPDDPRWRDQLLFYEYFNGEDGAGLGASHQTGWTGLVAQCLLDPPAPPR